MSRRKQSAPMFVVFALLIGILFIVGGIALIVAYTSDVQAQSEMLYVSIVIIILGVLLIIGGIIGIKVFGNANIGKSDKNVVINFQMEINGNVQQITHPVIIRDVLANLKEGTELNVTLTPEFFGLTSWKFVKIKGYYMSFPTIHKKDKYIQYFTMPNKNVESTLEPFMEVYVEKKAVNTSNLMDMKRYGAVMDYYKLG